MCLGPCCRPGSGLDGFGGSVFRRARSGRGRRWRTVVSAPPAAMPESRGNTSARSVYWLNCSISLLPDRLGLVEPARLDGGLGDLPLFFDVTGGGP